MKKVGGNMATKLQAIEAQVMRLGPKARAKLAERLILSIWLDEAERRVNEIRKGRVRLRPAAAVLRRIRRQIAQKRLRSTR
jgi:hypothetical protein